MKLLRYNITVKLKQFLSDISHTPEGKKQIVRNIKNYFLIFYVNKITIIRIFV